MARAGRTPSANVIRLDQLDERAVARGLERVIELELDGERILYDETTQEVLVLNASAGLIWQNLDGDGSLGALIDDFAAAFSIDRAAVGADVLDTVRQLASHGFVEGIAGTPQFLADPPIGCSSCVDRLDELDWGPTTTFRIGELHIGVRSTDPEVDDLLRVALAAYVDDDVDAPVNFSLRIGAREGRAQAGLHILYQASDQLARSAVPSAIVRALFAQLDSYASSPLRGHLRLRVPAVVVDGIAILVAPDLAPVVLDVEPRLRRSGFELTGRPVADIDTATGELVVSTPAMALATGTTLALVELDRSRPTTRSAARMAADGRYPLAGWITIEHDELGAPNRPEELVALFDLVEQVDVNTPPATLEQIDRTFPMHRRVGVRAITPVALANAIVETARHGQCE